MVNDSFNRVLISMLIGLLFPLTLWGQANPNIQRRQMPEPRVYIMGKDSVRFYGGVIDNKISLVYSDGLKIEPEGYGFFIQSYSVKKERDGMTNILAICHGSEFPPKVKQIFKRMNEGDKIYISDILIQHPCVMARIMRPLEIEYRRKK